MSDFIKPSLSADDIYEGKQFEETVPGVYQMAIAGNLRVRKTQKGDMKLEVFLKHVDPDNASRYKGVNGAVMLTGTDKNGKPLARQFGDLLHAIGFSKDDITADGTGVNLLGDLDTADWKGVSAAVAIRGDVVDLVGRECMVKVGANTFEGKTKIRADAFYPLS